MTTSPTSACSAPPAKAVSPSTCGTAGRGWATSINAIPAGFCSLSRSPGEPPQAVHLTTSGGVTDGDSLKMAIEVGPGATAVATTQAAEKIYRAAKGGGHCAIDVAVRVAEGAALEWLPQETIVFEGARLKRRTVAEVEPGGSLLACEMVVLGRAASGETFTRGLLLDSWSVRRTSRLAWTDTLRVEGQTPTGAGFGAANALATVIGVWDAPQPQFEKARALLDGRDATCAPASPW